MTHRVGRASLARSLMDRGAMSTAEQQNGVPKCSTSAYVRDL
jgi:hypothetical protein